MPACLAKRYHERAPCYLHDVTGKVISSSALPVDLRPLLGEASLEVPKEGQLSRGELLELLPKADGLIALLNVRVDSELLAAGKRLKIVANFAVGYDNVDLAEATRRGVVVTNTPDVLTDATADFAFTLLLAAARRLGEGERLVRAGAWQGWAPGLLLGTELRGRRLGVVGAGRIGRALLQRAKGFAMDLVYDSPRQMPEAEALGARHVSREELLATCDFVSLHCPLSQNTKGLIDAKALATMKPTAILVNTARGACVDHEALADALESGAIAGAGLDVFENEPQVPERLLELESVVLAPHIASATLSARTKMAEICANAIRTRLQGSCPPTALNPEAMQ